MSGDGNLSRQPTDRTLARRYSMAQIGLCTTVRRMQAHSILGPYSSRLAVLNFFTRARADMDGISLYGRQRFVRRVFDLEICPRLSLSLCSPLELDDGSVSNIRGHGARLRVCSPIISAD